MTLSLIKRYYLYNAWANNRLVKALEKLTPAQLAEPGCSGNGSVMQTLSHLLNTEYEWFQWHSKEERGDGVKIESLEEALDGGNITSLDEAQKWLVIIDTQTQNFLNTLTEEMLHQERSFTMRDGSRRSVLLWELLLHTANHATHTRAQIIAAIRRNNINPGGFDLLHFMMLGKN